MAVITDIKNLSQTASLNGPDGAVDPPSTLDDQDRFLGSFIAMLRDGVGFTAGAPVVALGYTPVRQGTGPGQQTNTVSLGWNAAAGRLYVSVDNNPFGNVWPIDVNYALAIRNTGVLGGAPMTFSWRDPGAIPGYLWGGDSPGDMYLTPPSRLNVNYSTSSGTASNANAVNGISGWNYSNRAKNPAYMWVSDGATNDQFLTQPGNLSVNYANTCNRADNCRYADSAGYAGSAGSAPASGGTADNANAFQGRGADYWLNNGNSALRNIHNNGGNQLIATISGAPDAFWGVNPISDERLKRNIAPSTVDALGEIMRIKFVQFRYRDDIPWFKRKDDPPNHPATFQIDDGRLHKIGVTTQQLQTVNPDLVETEVGAPTPRQDELLWRALRAVQQLGEQVKALQAKLSAS